MDNLTSGGAIAMNLHPGGAGHSGPQWGHESEDLNVTLLSWPRGHTIAEHLNSEVDVVIVAVWGEAEITVDDELHRLATGTALLIPKGARRAVSAISDFSYLSIHRRRRGLMPSFASSKVRPNNGVL